MAPGAKLRPEMVIVWNWLSAGTMSGVIESISGTQLTLMALLIVTEPPTMPGIPADPAWVGFLIVSESLPPEQVVEVKETKRCEGSRYPVVWLRS